jgi:hypothetical protein
MYIRILLEHKNNNDPNTVMAIIFKEGNVDYLVRGEDNPEFPNLSLVESYDYSDFGPEDVTGIIRELTKVKEEVSDPSDKAHIDDIIHLAERCKTMPDTVLVFAG